MGPSLCWLILVVEVDMPEKQRACGLSSVRDRNGSHVPSSSACLTARLSECGNLLANSLLLWKGRL